MWSDDKLSLPILTQITELEANKWLFKATIFQVNLLNSKRIETHSLCKMFFISFIELDKAVVRVIRLTKFL